MPKDPIKLVKVKVAGGLDPRTKEVIGQPLHEDGTTHEPGSVFETTEDRAKALGAQVSIVA